LRTVTNIEVSESGWGEVFSTEFAVRRGKQFILMVEMTWRPP
jgi:hypothetical protein